MHAKIFTILFLTQWGAKYTMNQIGNSCMEYKKIFPIWDTGFYINYVAEYWEDLKTKFKSHNSFLRAELNMAKHICQIG